jgi:hypothetical protein
MKRALTFSPAFSVVAAACRAATVGTANSDENAGDAESYPGIEAVLDMAVRHRISAPVIRRLARSNRLSVIHADRLRAMATERSQSALTLAAHSAKLSAALTAAGVRHLILKGPVLAERLYGDIAARDCKDIDLFVDPATRMQALGVIADCGYRPGDAEMLSAGADDWRDRVAPKDFSFRHSLSRVEVELHSRLFDVEQLLPRSFEALWHARETVVLAGVSIPVLSVVDEFLYLCGHGALHAWFRLKWIQDIARIIATAPASTIADIARAADAAGVTPMVTSAAMLAETLLGVSAPQVLAGPSSRASNLVMLQSIRALAAPAEASNAPSIAGIARMSLLQLSLRRDWRYRCSVISRLLVSQNDLATITLPRGTRWAYYPLRPLLVTLRRWRRWRQLPGRQQQ